MSSSQRQQQQANGNTDNRHRGDDNDDDDRPIEIFLHHDHQEEDDDDDDDFYTQTVAEATTENNDNGDPPSQGQTTRQQQREEEDDALATANHRHPYPEEEFLQTTTTTTDDFLVLTQQQDQEEEQDHDANPGRTRTTTTAALQDDNEHEQQQQEKEPTNKDQQVSQQQEQQPQDDKDDEEQVVPPRKITRNRRSNRAAQKGTTKTTTGEHENNTYREEDFNEKHGATKLIPRPRGRAKVGHVWDGVTGAWVPKDDNADDDDDTNDAATGSKAARSRSTSSKRSLPVAGKKSAADDDAKTTTTITPKPKRTKRTSLTTPTALEALPSPEMKAKHDQIVVIAREDLWDSDENVIVDALMKLSELCEPDDAESCRQLAFESGVHTLIVKLLERKTKAKELQERGLEVLFRISASSSPTIEKALLTMGSVEVAVKAMLKFPEHVDIQVYACVLLGNLTNTPGGWDAIQQSAIKVQAMSENASGQDQNNQGAEQDQQVQQGEPPADRQAPTSSQLLAAVQVAQERHVDSEEMQEAAAFFLDRCLAIAGKPVLDLLVTTAPGSMHSLLLAKQTFGSNNASISRKVVSFFREVSTLC